MQFVRRSAFGHMRTNSARKRSPARKNRVSPNSRITLNYPALPAFRSHVLVLVLVPMPRLSEPCDAHPAGSSRRNRNTKQRKTPQQSDLTLIGREKDNNLHPPSFVSTRCPLHTPHLHTLLLHCTLPQCTHLLQPTVPRLRSPFPPRKPDHHGLHWTQPCQLHRDSQRLREPARAATSATFSAPRRISPQDAPLVLHQLRHFHIHATAQLVARESRVAPKLHRVHRRRVRAPPAQR